MRARCWLRALVIVTAGGCVGLPPQPPADEAATIADTDDGPASSGGAVTTTDSGSPGSTSVGSASTTLAADSGSTTIDGSSSSGSECLERCPAGWECVGGGCVNPDEGEVCELATDCGPAAPFCAPDGLCHDGTPGDSCNEGECLGPLACGPNAACQGGQEGDPCAEPGDCAASASVCSPNGQCQDGGEGDPCMVDSDCGVDVQCGPANACQDGSEGDPCAGPEDCGDTAPFCPYDGLCHDGSIGDPCDTVEQCMRDMGACYVGVCAF